MASIDETLGEDSSSEITWAGGSGTFFAQGFDDETLTLEFSIDGSTWTTVNDIHDNAAQLTANGHADFTLGPCQLRIKNDGGSSSGSGGGVKVRVTEVEGRI